MLHVPGPHDDPLGSRPTLPPPDGSGARRAQELFRYLVKTERRAAETAMLPGAPPPAEVFGGGRSYDQALAAIAAAVAMAGGTGIHTAAGAPEWDGAESPAAPEDEPTRVFARPDA